MIFFTKTNSSTINQLTPQPNSTVDLQHKNIQKNNIICEHTFIYDTIDITPDYCKNIIYCSKCLYEPNYKKLQNEKIEHPS